MHRKGTSYVGSSRTCLRTAMKVETRVHAGLVGLLLLSCVQVSALDCNLLKHRQKVFNQQSLELWQEMSTKFSPECLNKMSTFNFPTKILQIQESQAALEAIHEILRGFLNILSSDSLQAGWKGAHRERFLQMVHAHTEALKGCLGGRKLAPGKLKEWRHKLALKRYFRRIRTFLRENEGSTCCWQSLKREVRAGIIYVDILTNRMK